MKVKTNKKSKVSQKSTKKQSSKNAIKPIQKITEFVKNKIQSNKENAENEQIQKDKHVEKSNSDIDINFFYTDDKFIYALDDKEIKKYIQDKYTDYKIDQCRDIELKKLIVTMLQDRPFINELLQYFNITLFDFFKFLFRLDTSIFKGPFLNKIIRITKQKKYI